MQSKEESQKLLKRKKALLEIFKFYSCQHIYHFDKLFDELGEIIQRVEKGDFVKFTKDFGLCCD